MENFPPEFSQCFGDKASPEDLTDADLLTQLEFNNDGNYLASGDRGGRVVIFRKGDDVKIQPNNHLYSNVVVPPSASHQRGRSRKRKGGGGEAEDEMEDACDLTDDEEGEKNGSPRRRYGDEQVSKERYGCKFKFYCEFQSHEAEFDYLKSLEIEEKINQIKWLPNHVNNANFLLSSNDKTIKLWKLYEQDQKDIILEKPVSSFAVNREKTNINVNNMMLHSNSSFGKKDIGDEENLLNTSSLMDVDLYYKDNEKLPAFGTDNNIWNNYNHSNRDQHFYHNNNNNNNSNKSSIRRGGLKQREEEDYVHDDLNALQNYDLNNENIDSEDLEEEDDIDLAYDTSSAEDDENEPKLEFEKDDMQLIEESHKETIEDNLTLSMSSASAGSSSNYDADNQSETAAIQNKSLSNSQSNIQVNKMVKQRIYNKYELPFPKLLSNGNKLIRSDTKRVYANAHAYHINSLSVCSDGLTFLSADDLRINIWSLESNQQTFTLADMKPENMEDLNEVITSATYHPSNTHMLLYSSSRGILRLCDLRESSTLGQDANFTGSRGRGAARIFENFDVVCNNWDSEMGPNNYLGTCETANNIPTDKQHHNSNKSFFSEIVSSISDVKFINNEGRYIVSRDYLSIKIWDTHMESGPVNTIHIHDHLRPHLCELYHRDAIFDKFECEVSPCGNYILTGSYNNSFHVHHRLGLTQGSYTEIAKSISRKKQLLQARQKGSLQSHQMVTGAGALMDTDRNRNPDNNWIDGMGPNNNEPIDFDKKVLHLSWHPNRDTVAIAGMNRLYFYSV